VVTSISSTTPQMSSTRMLLVSRLKPTIAAAGGHAGVGIRNADLLELPGLSAGPSSLNLVIVGISELLDMTNSQTVPTHVRANERVVDVDDLALRDRCCNARLNRSLEDLLERSQPQLCRIRVSEE
jgi:hypothetical protein